MSKRRMLQKKEQERKHRIELLIGLSIIVVGVVVVLLFTSLGNKKELSFEESQFQTAYPGLDREKADKLREHIAKFYPNQPFCVDNNRCWVGRVGIAGDVATGVDIMVLDCKGITLGDIEINVHSQENAIALFEKEIGALRADVALRQALTDQGIDSCALITNAESEYWGLLDWAAVALLPDQYRSQLWRPGFPEWTEVITCTTLDGIEQMEELALAGYAFPTMRQLLNCN